MAVAAPATATATASDSASAAAAHATPTTSVATATPVAAVTTTAIDRIKSVFRRALTALRYAVAAAVTVVVVMTAVYAFHVVARTDDLNIEVVNGYISVDPQNRTDAKLSFTLSVDNPSGRVRFYYTDINCVLNVNDSRNSTAEFGFPDIVVATDSELLIGKDDANLNSNQQGLIDSFNKSSGIFFYANLTLTGNLTVGVYSGAHNKTRVSTTYHCRSLIVGNVSGSSSDMGSTSCLTVGKNQETPADFEVGVGSGG